MLCPAMPFLRYTAQRLLLLVAVLGLAWIVGLRGLLLVVVGVFGSGLLSLVLLSRSRDAASVALSDRMSSANRRIQRRAAAEDAWDEQARAAGEGREAPGERRP